MLPAIEIQGLGKRYMLGERTDAYLTLRDSLAGLVRRRDRSERSELWALRDVDLTIGEGEAVGLIGRNGAGKSTLLKVIARITEPTTGVARMRGRVGALLEVGTGFHQELTGRENIYFNGAVLGMSQRDIRRRFDEIVEFAGIGRFLDTPLKRYSSGMYMRLAFSVAAHLEPDIVVVDEVLAVGDLEFRERCMSKMTSLQTEGRTILFVSHDLTLVGRLCSRCILLEDGMVAAEGPTDQIIRTYLERVSTHGALKASSDGPVRVLSAFVSDGDGRPLDAPRRDEPLRLRLEIEVREPIPDLDVSYYLLSEDGTRVLNDAWSDTGEPSLIGRPGRYETAIDIPPVLAAGRYTVGAWLGTQLDDYFLGDVFSFELAPAPGDDGRRPDRPRAAHPRLEWEVTA